MSQPLGSHYLDEARRQFRGYKRLAEGAIAQLKDEELFITLDPEANSIAVIMKHISGNMRSRFTDFLTTDGEKPDRQRDQEFEMNADATRAEVLRRWEEGWTCVFSAIEALKPKDSHHTRRTAHRSASPQPPSGALCLSHRADRISSQTFPLQ